MIRAPKPKTEKQLLRASLATTRRQIAQYEAPSTLGPRHDAHVRPRWNACIAELREHEAGLLASIEALS